MTTTVAKLINPLYQANIILAKAGDCVFGLLGNDQQYRAPCDGFYTQVCSLRGDDTTPFALGPFLSLEMAVNVGEAKIEIYG